MAKPPNMDAYNAWKSGGEAARSAKTEATRAASTPSPSAASQADSPKAESMPSAEDTPAPEFDFMPGESKQPRPTYDQLSGLESPMTSADLPALPQRSLEDDPVGIKGLYDRVVRAIEMQSLKDRPKQTPRSHADMTLRGSSARRMQ